MLFLTTTTDKFTADYATFWKGCPNYFPASIKNPNHLAMEVLELLSSFGPAITSLIGCSFDMLYKCILSGWESIYSSVFLGEKLFSFTIYMLLTLCGHTYRRMTNCSRTGSHCSMHVHYWAYLPKHRMLGSHLDMPSRCSMRFSYLCLQKKMTLYHTQ